MKIGVQLYTVRDVMEKDPWMGLEKLSQMGFRNVEMAGLHDKSAEEWAENLQRFGLEAISSHCMLADLENNLDGVINQAKLLGYRYVVCPWVAPEEYASGWPVLAARLNEIGMRLFDEDITFAYHNHDFEFAKVGADTGLDLIFKNTNSSYVVAELDVFWAQFAGFDPGPMIVSMAGRIPLVHFKDMDGDRKFTEVGAGILDWDEIIESAHAAGAEYAIIENDQPSIDSMESVAASREFLLRSGLTD